MTHQTDNQAGERTQIKFGPRIKWTFTTLPNLEEITLGEFGPLLGKRVAVTFNENKVIIGRLGRNSFKNRTLCIITGTRDEELYGKFFFEPDSVEFIQELV